MSRISTLNLDALPDGSRFLLEILDGDPETYRKPPENADQDKKDHFWTDTT